MVITCHVNTASTTHLQPLRNEYNLVRYIGIQKSSQKRGLNQTGLIMATLLYNVLPVAFVHMCEK
jgi:hypothetical protein